MSRKPIEQEMRGGKPPRQRVWEAIRKHPEGFTQAQIVHAAKVSDSIAQDYVKALCKAGFVVVVGKEPVGRICHRFTYKLARDNGVEAPRLNKAGEEVVQGGINEAMWGTLRRVLRGQTFNYRELAAFAGTVTQVIPELTAKTYVLALAAAGYLDCVQPALYGKRAALARYRLKREMESGPRAPMIQRTKVVYDPNWNRVVWIEEKGAEDEVL